ncbi:hypothetical protein ACTXT7_000148 [Hymenolepis weldensis]
MRGYIPGEDDLQGVLRYRSKHQRRRPRLDQRVQPYPVPRRKQYLFLTPEQPVISRCSATTRKKRSRYYPNVLPGLDGISLVSRSISRQRRISDQIYEPHIRK